MTFNWVKWFIMGQQWAKWARLQNASKIWEYQFWWNKIWRGWGCFISIGCYCAAGVAAVKWSLFSMLHDSFQASFIIIHSLPHPLSTCLLEKKGMGDFWCSLPLSPRELNGKASRKSEVSPAPSAFLPVLGPCVSQFR